MGGGYNHRPMDPEPQDAAPEELGRPPCPLCGGEARESLFSGYDRRHGVPGRFGVVRCRLCGHVYTCPRPRDLDACYPEDYAPYRSKLRRAGALRRAMLRAFAGYPGPAPRWALWPFWPFWRLGRRYPETPPWTGEGRLLDLGCGGGSFLLAMRDLGRTVAGVEPDERAVAACREQGLDVRQGVLPCPEVPDASFDVVTVRHVLEHTPNPGPTLEDVYRVLAPGGRVLVGVPLFDGLAAQRFGPDWYHLDLPRHLSHFTQPALLSLLREVGFREVRLLAERRRSVWTRSYGLRYESRGRRLDRWLSRRGWLARALDLWACLRGHPNQGVAVGRK